MSKPNAQNIVESYLNAFFANPTNLDDIRPLLHPSFTFAGPLLKANSPDDYMAKLSAMGPIYLKAEIHHILAEDNIVAVLFSFLMGSETHLASEWYDIQNGRILSIRLCNDPRPFLQAFGG